MMFASDPSLGVSIGPPPPPPVTEVQPANPPGPGFVWIGGYWFPEDGHYIWHDGHWMRPAYDNAHWMGPRYESGRYYEGYWEGPNGRISIDRKYGPEGGSEYHH
jgi:hypothetical protein